MNVERALGLMRTERPMRMTWSKPEAIKRWTVRILMLQRWATSFTVRSGSWFRLDEGVRGIMLRLLSPDLVLRRPEILQRHVVPAT
jgi:hypothetical protein